MITLLLVLLAILAIATGLGAARDNGSDEQLTWGGYSRTQVKKTLRRMGFRAPCGAALAALMGDEAWVPVPQTGTKSFSSVPRQGRVWTTERRRSLRRNEVTSGTAKKAIRAVTSTRAAVAAKRQRDLAASAAKVARRAERSSNRAHATGVWAARLREEQAARVAASAARPWPTRVKAAPQPTISWLGVVRAARQAEELVSLARGTSSASLHEQADALEAVLAAERLIANNARLIAPATAHQFGLEFQITRAGIAARWAVCDLREELLAA